MSISASIFISVFYIVLFFLMQSYFTPSKKIKYSKSDTIMMFCIMGAALLLRILLSQTIKGHETDINCFRAWSGKLGSEGMKNFYSPDYFCDYPPLYMMVLYIIGKFKIWFNLDYETTFVTLVKLPAILADIGVAALLYFKSRKSWGNKVATALAFVVLICPAFFINSTLWGQIDAIFALLIGASLICLYEDKFKLGAFLYALSMLVKPQAFIVAPVYLAVYFFKALNNDSLESIKDIPAKFKETNWKEILICIGIGLATVFVVALPFTRDFNFMWIIDKYKATLSSYNYATVNAFNVYALFGFNWKELTTKFLFLPVSVWSTIAILFTVALSFWFYFKAKDKTKIFYMGYLIVMTMFTLGAKMHERYVFPALILLALCFIYKKDKRFLYLFLAQSTTQFLNASEVLRANLAGNIPVNETLTWVVSLLTIATYAYSIKLIFDIYVPLPKKEASKNTDEEYKFKKEAFVPGKMVRIDYIIMAVITLVYGVTAFVNLGDMEAPQTFHHTVFNTQSEVVTADESGNETATTQQSSEMILDLGASRAVDKITMYIGVGDSDCNYNISTSRDGQIYTPFGDSSTHYPVFTWREFKPTTATAARYVKIECSKENMMIGEIGILDVEGNTIPYTTDIPEFNDEQSMVQTTATYLNGSYFDEIYHPRTAYEISHQMAPYETTHPPLGKLLIALGTMIFGMTPFGWRFMGTLTGVLMLPLMYMFIKKLFNNTKLAAIGTFLFAFDFMHFAQTRLATIDSYGVFFIMLTFYFLTDYLAIDFNNDPLKKGFIPLMLTGITFGIGCASKWICIYSAFGIAIILLVVWIRAYKEHMKKHMRTDFEAKFWKTFGWCCIWFIAVPIVIYVASYIPQVSYDLHGRTVFGYIWQSQEYMFNYHSGLTSTHPYSSQWYEWIYMKKPLWAYVNGNLSNQGICSSISTFGNPAVWWLGIIALITTVYVAIKKKSTKVLMIIIPYLTQLVPWMLVSRVVFIYHYFACVPFMVMAIVYLLDYLHERYHLSYKVMYGYCAVALALFIMFYPVISGMPVDKDYVMTYLKWFDGWVFIT